MAFGFQTSAFQNNAFQSVGVAASTAVAAVGGASRRKRYVIDDRPLRLTREELDTVLERMLREAELPPRKQLKRYVMAAPTAEKALITATPQYVTVRERLIAQQQHDAAERLRQIVQKMADDEDERDIERLILYG